jgi:hypothetical protein
MTNQNENASSSSNSPKDESLPTPQMARKRPHYNSEPEVVEARKEWHEQRAVKAREGVLREKVNLTYTSEEVEQISIVPDVVHAKGRPSCAHLTLDLSEIANTFGPLSIVVDVEAQKIHIVGYGEHGAPAYKLEIDKDVARKLPEFVDVAIHEEIERQILLGLLIRASSGMK